MSNSPFRATVDMTGEQQSALDLLARRTGRSRNALIREAIDAYLRLQFPPAEAARDDSDGGDSPPSAPVATSRAASAGGSQRALTEKIEKAKRRQAKMTEELEEARRGSAFRPLTRWCSPPTHSVRGRE